MIVVTNSFWQPLFLYFLNNTCYIEYLVDFTFWHSKVETNRMLYITEWCIYKIVNTQYPVELNQGNYAKEMYRVAG